MKNRGCLLGLTLEELKTVCSELSLPSFTAKQIAHWLYVKRVTSFDEMSNLSLSNREQLATHYKVGREEPTTVQKSKDGTRKYLFNVGENEQIETVFIPDKERATLCVSSQIGCKMNCRFCQTGKQGFQGNLTESEIMNQIFSVEEAEELTNLVFMGMGEPLDNYEVVRNVITVLTSDWGLAWSPKRITVSTVGITPTLKRLLDETSVHIAISLHNPYSEERLAMIPTEKAYPTDELLQLLRQYNFSGQRRLSFEYILFNGVNDSNEHGLALVQKIKGMYARVNLIRFHAIPKVDLQTTPTKQMIAFRDLLDRKGIQATIRSSRGEDIDAACGMLKSKTKN